MMAADPRPLIADLADETAALDEMLDLLDEARWQLPTPSTGWDIADQVGHLAYFDDAARVSLTDPERFRRETAELRVAGADGPDRIASDHRHLSGRQVFTWFRRARRALLTGYADVDPAVRLPWYGPDMGVASSITARLMETWAHGQDIADALGVQRIPTARLRHIAHLGIKAMPYSYTVNDLPVPAGSIRVELVGPDGERWIWGPADAADSVAGPALDFALVVTQRRHHTDTALTIAGPIARQWIGIAQAFAGPAGPGRPSLSGPA